jgi:hypothetical protein
METLEKRHGAAAGGSVLLLLPAAVLLLAGLPAKLGAGSKPSLAEFAAAAATPAKCSSMTAAELAH